MVSLSEELKARIKELFLSAAINEFERDEKTWIIQMMEQDHYDIILKQLPAEDYALVEKQMEESGCYPSEEVNNIIDLVEVEVFGRIVCE